MHHPVPDCPCCSAGLRRRALIGLGGAATAALLLRQGHAAEKPRYDAMVLSCIDPRIIDPVHSYLTRRGLDRKYSQFVFAGAAVGAVAPAFAAWHQTFWDNLATSMELHKINRVIAIDHRDCGAARIAYGADSIATPERETATHRRVLTEFKQAVLQRHPKLGVEGGLMALEGSYEVLV
ncbi:MAG TPA: hypothetical protein VME92_19505 [Acetobacteraceae bacterium]|nr:hypothetical protein [Acetobacteraceae bacterium]